MFIEPLEEQHVYKTFEQQPKYYVGVERELEVNAVVEKPEESRQRRTRLRQGAHY